MGRQGTAASRVSYKQFRAEWSWSATAIFCGLALAATGAFLLAAPFFPDVAPANVRADWLALATLITGLFTANMARMLQIWAKLKPVVRIQPIKRLEAQRKTADRSFRELFIYLFGAFGGLTAFTFLSAQPGMLPWENLGLHGVGSDIAKPRHVAALIAVVGLALIPLISGFYLQSREEQDALKREMLRADAISASSFWMGAALLAGIIALASWAAQVSQNQQEGVAANLAYWITFAVVALFVAFIFLPHIQRYIDHLAESEREPGDTAANTPLLIGAPAIALSWFDSILVRFIAPLTGATQHGPLVPHGFVILSLVPLTALGFILPQPYGLAPIALGMLMVIALGRRWAWIEEDREIASRLLRTDGKEIQIGFENDLKDEALLGYAFLFILVPLALHQINGVFHAFTGADGAPISDPFFAWLSFFGGELAKAVPFVDWWEIYSVDIRTPVAGACVAGDCSGTQAPNIVPAAKHLTFAARAMVDLVIMAALFQAIGIWQRSRAQDRLYDAGQLDAFDPFTEVRFFKQGMKKAEKAGKTGKAYIARKKFEERVEKHMQLRKDLHLPKVPYNQFRLGELLLHADPEVRAGAEWMLDQYGVLAGTPCQKLQQLSEQWRKAWFEGTPESAAIRSLAKEEQQVWRRAEKLRLEALLDELMDDEDEEVPAFMSSKDVANVVQLVVIAGAAAEFHYARVIVMELLARIPDPSAFWALAAQACRNGPCLSDWRSQIDAMFADDVRSQNGVCASAHHGRQEMRALCFAAIADQVNGYQEGDLMNRTVLNFLEDAESCGEGTIAAEALKKAIKGVRIFVPPAQQRLRPPRPSAQAFEFGVETEDEDEPELEPT